MSVYKRPGAETFSFDFEVAGSRFSGDTGKTSKREALRVQDLKRADAKADAKAGRTGPSAQMTFGEAAALYMLQVGLFHVNKLTTQADLERLERRIGKTKRLIDITDADVAQLVADRRNDVRAIGLPENRTRRVGPSTVNRSTTEPLRKVMTRARKVWKLPVHDIDWSQHMLREPQERVREATQAEEYRITGELSRGYEEALEFDFINGLRVMELVGLTWARVDLFGRRFTVIGKGGKSRTIPMTQRSFEILRAQLGRHPEFVFTYAAKRTDRRKKLIRTHRYPITNSGFRIAQQRAIKRAGVTNFHPHDVRHTTATRVLRQSNLKAVKNLLGHQDISTTDRYAHALENDILDALEAVAAAPLASISAAPKRSDGTGRGEDAVGLGATGRAAAP